MKYDFAYFLIFIIINNKYYLSNIIINRIKIIIIYIIKNEINFKFILYNDKYENNAHIKINSEQNNY